MRIVHILVTGMLLSLCFCIGAFFFIIQQPWVDLSVLEHYNPGKPSILYDEKGRTWATFELDKREIITYKDIPPHVIHAFVSAEDWNFFNHGGISYKGIIRSTLVNLYHRRVVQGASTITQQIIKLLFFDLSRSFKRKIKEQFLALLVEKQFTKEQILETYLNHIYFGAGIYGIKAACQRLWGIDVKDISIDQAAILAGIVRSPARYCPLYNMEESFKRRNTILESMQKLSYITQDEYHQYSGQNITLKEQTEDNACALHLKETIRIMLEDMFGKDTLYTGGLHIYTTLNKDIQNQAETVFKEKVSAVKSTKLETIDGALISLDPRTGAIRALIGGYDYNSSQFNRALKARRQIGSTFKPLIYATALDSGLIFSDTAVDEPIEVTFYRTPWRPKNSHQKFEGKMTLAYALSRSNNIVTIKTLLKTGIHKVIKKAQEAGITGHLPAYPSLALGCTDASLQEVAGFMNIFANQGIYTRPHFITSVKDQWGNKIYKHKPCTRRVFSDVVCGQIIKILSIGVKRIERLILEKPLDQERFGKTGTTNDFRTCWFAGSTPDLTTALYLGKDDNQPMQDNHIYASRTVLPIWHAFNRSLRTEKKSFSLSPLLKKVIIHNKEGIELDTINQKYAIEILIPTNKRVEQKEPFL
jgi:penicillin-binding protein 1A